MNIYSLPGVNREAAFCVIGNFVPITQKRSAGMRTAAYIADVASDRRRRKNVPRHILCSSACYSLPKADENFLYKHHEKVLEY